MSREVCAGRGAHRRGMLAGRPQQLSRIIKAAMRGCMLTAFGDGAAGLAKLSAAVYMCSHQAQIPARGNIRLDYVTHPPGPPPLHSTLTTVKAGSNPRAAAESAWCHAGLLSGVMCTPTWCPCCSALATVVAVAPAASTSATTRHTTSSSTAARVSPCHAWVGRTGAGRPGGRGAAAAGPGGAAGALPGGRLAAGAAEACPGPGAPLPSAGCC